jgi:ABC-2 type transport system permease protein
MNALTLKSLVTHAPRGNDFGAYLTETRYELTRMIRSPQVVVPGLLMAPALYALFALAIAGEAINKDANTGTFIFWAFSLMSVTMLAMFGVGVSLGLERDMGLLRLKRAQPAPPAAWVVAKVVSGMAMATVSYALILVLALAAGKLPLAAGQVMALSAGLLIGTIPFTALGLMIGSLASGSATSNYALLAYLPGCYLSGMFFPLPASMYWQAPIWPQFHVGQLAMHLAGITKFQFEPLQMAIATLLGYTVLFAGVTVWRLQQRD